MSTLAKELEKQYATFTKSFSDEEIQLMIHRMNVVMGAPAQKMLSESGIYRERKEGFRLLDNGCGMGLVASQVIDIVDHEVLLQSEIFNADVNPEWIKILKQRIEKESWVNTKAEILDAQHTKLPAGSFTHETLNFAMHIIPDPEAVLREALTLLEPGGTLAFTVWHKDNGNRGWVPDMRSTIETYPFDTPLPDPMPMTINQKPEWADPEGIETVMRKYNFENIKIETSDHVMSVADADDFADSFGMMSNWLLNTFWTEEQRAEHLAGFKDRMIEHLKEKHDGKGWDLPWTLILVTCQTPKAAAS